MDITKLPTLDLLAALVGDDAAEALYDGSLAALFVGGALHDEPTAKLLIARELVKRWLEEDLGTRDVLGSPASVREYLCLHFAGQGHETFVVLYLDAQNHLIAAEDLFRGTLTQTSVYPREVVKRALYWNAASVILAHNHPSGVAEPSRADEMLTDTLRQTLALVDIKVLDHFVVAGRETVSFAERGMV